MMLRELLKHTFWNIKLVATMHFYRAKFLILFSTYNIKETAIGFCTGCHRFKSSSSMTPEYYNNHSGHAWRSWRTNLRPLDKYELTKSYTVKRRLWVGMVHSHHSELPASHAIFRLIWLAKIFLFSIFCYASLHDQSYLKNKTHLHCNTNNYIIDKARFKWIIEIIEKGEIVNFHISLISIYFDCFPPIWQIGWQNWDHYVTTSTSTLSWRQVKLVPFMFWRETWMSTTNCMTQRYRSIWRSKVSLDFSRHPRKCYTLMTASTHLDIRRLWFLTGWN